MYLAMLRQRQSELRALNNLSDEVTNCGLFMPIISINDGSKETLELVNSKYSGPLLLDIKNLEAEDIESLEDILSENDNNHIEILYPVSTLFQNDECKSIHYVKIEKDSFSLTTFLLFEKWCKENLPLLPKFIVIDIGQINNNVDAALEQRIVRLIHHLKDKDICILSGSIPSTVPVSATTNYNQPRHEIELFSRIKSQCIASSNNLIYGDYATVCPLPPEPSPMAIVQIKYTLDSSYTFFRNGLRRGNYDFVSVCNNIIASIPNYDPTFCWGDSYIQEVSDRNTNKGNPSVWASIGINRHIAFSIEQMR